MNEIKKAGIGIGVLILYLFVTLYSPIYQMYLYHITPETPRWLIIGGVLLLEIMLLCSILLIYNKSLKKDWKDLKKKHKKYFKDCFKYWIIGLIVMCVSNLALSLFNADALPTNEETIRSVFSVAPLYMFISAVFIAPLSEELVFRKAFRDMISSKWLYVILSGLVFGALHVFLSLESLFEIWYIIPYSSLGIAFAYMYAKTNNIFVNVGFHLLHNGILISLQFLLLLFA